MKRTFLTAGLLLLTIAFMAGCGGSTSEDGISGIVVDPYISGARFQEMLADGTPGQLSSFSDEQGRFSFPEGISDGSQIVMVQKGLHNGAAYDGTLRSCAELIDGELVVSPYTTVLANLVATGQDAALAKETLLGMLGDAGHTLELADLTADPMVGITGEGGFERLRGAMAVNGWLHALSNGSEDGFEVTDPDSYLAHLLDRQQILADMSAVMFDLFSEENLARTRLTLQDSLPDGYPISVDDMIRSSVTTCDYLADRVAADLGDGTVDDSITDMMADGAFEELLMRHYSERNMHNAPFAEIYQDSFLPEVSPGQVFSMEEILESMGSGGMMGSIDSNGNWSMGMFDLMR